MNEFAQYILNDIPYQAGGQGPDAFDCMGFFRMIQRVHFGIAVPEILASDYDDEQAIVSAFQHDERTRWLPVGKPLHGDAVIVHRPMHIGVWLDVDGGGVLHCVRDVGVVFTKDAAWSVSGFGRREFYRHESKVPNHGDR